MSGLVHGDTLATRGECRRLAPGEILVRIGDQSDAVFLVTQGAVVASIPSADGEVEVGRSTAGEVIGEVAALAGLKRSATLRAVGDTAGDTAGDTEVVVVHAVDFAAWLDEHPDRSAEMAAAARQRLNTVHVAEIAVQMLGEAAHDLVPEMLAAAEWVDVEAGSVLFHEGDIADAAYFVLSGRLQATTVDRNGTDRNGTDRDGALRVLNDIGRGEILGELAVIQRSPRTATITAMRDSTLARFAIADFERLLTSHPPLMLLVVRRMVARLTGNSRPVRTARSVTLVILADVPVDEIVEPMRRVIGEVGASAVLDSALVDAQLGHDGASQVSSTDIGDTRLSQYLYEVEGDHEHLIFVADRTPTPWSRRVIQRADSVVIVTSAHPDAQERHRVSEFLAACTDTRVPRWLAIMDSAGASRPTPAPSVSSREQFHEVHHLRRGNTGDLERLARLSVGTGVGLVLGGGGARGFAHLGVIRALREQGVPIDRMGGASMGSIFAALAGLYDDVDELTAVCSTQFDRLLDYTVPLVSLLKAKRITANLNNVMGGLDAEDTWTPFYCVSTNLTKSRLEVHRRGDLVTAIRASIAIPGVLPPVPFGDDLLVDGGVLDNVPADIMRADPSIGTVIAVDVAPPSGPGTREDYGMYLSGWQAMRRFVGRASSSSPYPGVGSVLIRTMITGSEGRRSKMKHDGTADLYLDLEMDGVGLLEFDKMTAVVERGYVAASPRIAEWLASRPELATGG